MSRVKRGVSSSARHKKTLHKAKTYYGRRKSNIRTAKQAVIKAGQYALRDRRARKRNFRSLFIQRINAATRLHGLSYARFMAGLARADIKLDRKMLAFLAMHDPSSFETLVGKARLALK